VLAGLTVRFGSAFTSSTTTPNTESARAYSLLSSVGKGGLASTAATQTGNIAWHVSGESITSAAVEKDAAAMLARVAKLPGVRQVTSPYSAAGARQLSTSANTAFATVALAKGADVASVEKAADAMRSSAVEVQTGGTAFTPVEGSSSGTEVIGVLAALLILLVVFRSAWAAALPVLTGVIGVAGGLLAVMLISHGISLQSTSLTMGSLIGLGVGIDYALLIVNRYRRALQAGEPVPDAIGLAVNTSGRSVLFAGVTVIAALLAMYFVGLSVLTGMGQAAAVTVLFTVATATTLLPALLAVLGPRVLSGRQRRALAAGRNGNTTALARPEPGTPAPAKPGLAATWAALVLRAPRRAAAASLVIIAVLAIPVLSMRVGNADASSDPAGSPTNEYFEMMAGAFGKGFEAQLLLVARTPDAAAQAAFAGLAKKLPAVSDVAAVTPAETVGKGVEVITVTPRTSEQDAATSDLVNTLRGTVIPAAESGTGLQVYVGGSTASDIDLSNALDSKLPLYLLLIGLLGFVLLTLAFRAILVPLTGAVTSLASIIAGLGAITAIFQFGWGSSLLGVGTGAPISFIVPVCIVGVVFGLSTDYQVFLVSRVHEEWENTKDSTASIRVGVTETARVIVMAMGIMVCVFGSFGFSGQRLVAAIGVGMAAAVLVDVLLVRLTLVPALMRLSGRWNWAFPRWAERFTPRLSLEGPATTAREATELPAIMRK
jgi:putative drug exporter of the RND superfamily